MKIANKKQWVEAFLSACEGGHLKNIQNLCEKQYLSKGWANIHFEYEFGLSQACGHGHLEVVKYLLTSPELVEEGHALANVHARYDAAFRSACAYGHLEVVKYLLTSPELEAVQTWADPHAMNDDGCRWACYNEHWEVIRWLVMDYGIDKTEDIERIIKLRPEIQEYFRVREECQAMKSVLTTTGMQGQTKASLLKL